MKVLVLMMLCAVGLALGAAACQEISVQDGCTKLFTVVDSTIDSIHVVDSVTSDTAWTVDTLRQDKFCVSGS